MMADDVGQKIVSPKAAQSPSLANPPPENITTDSSATVLQPLTSSTPTPGFADVVREDLVSTTEAAPYTSAHLIPRPPSNMSSSGTTPLPSASISAPSASAPAPRIRGGFEVDEDEDIEDEESGKDDVDVYDPAAGFDIDAPTPAHVQTPLDRTSQSPERENPTNSVFNQTSGSLDGASYSTTVVPGAERAPAPAGSAAQAPVEFEVKYSSSRSDPNGSLLQSVSKTRLAHDVIGMLEDRIQEDPRGDPEAYLELIDELKSRHKENDVRNTYEAYLTVFPLDVSSEWSAIFDNGLY
jgi:cleavage stimulation factor subunit 3